MDSALLTKLETMKSHLHQLMEREYQHHGEFLLASVVQDALSYGFVSYVDVPVTLEDILEISHFSAKSVVEYGLIHFSLNQSVIKESIRGTLLAVEGLGGSTDLIATSVFLGAAEELLKFGSHCYSQCIGSILNAISDFYVESGRSSSAAGIRVLLKHMAEHIPDLSGPTPRSSSSAQIIWSDSAVGEG
ncbi:hypothetical protein [Alicyclobacillus sp. SO9]|uniref:hypothetical protein n=1 Tax=Alicyclobacillus sp. SO9 TaxID=2665646 RepID=UPI0018E7A0A2|nr:hypothetical protein [Alicyclobacillus sp. SO9]QQE80641.1 hypothetical protein GI364_09710 [Alicyclobacillus sp. SO9]